MGTLDGYRPPRATVAAESFETGNSDYDALPVGVRQAYTLREYLWLSDSQKADLLRAETEPEWNE